MKNMKVAQKLILGFMIVAALGVIVGVVGIFGMSSMSTAIENLYDENVVALEALGMLNETFASERNAMRTIILHSPGMPHEDPVRYKNARDSFAETAITARQAFELYETTIIDESLEGEYRAVEAAWKGPYETTKETAFKMMDDGDYVGAYSYYIAEGALVVGPIQEGLAICTANNIHWSEEAHYNAEDLYNTLFFTLVAVLAVAAAVAIFLAIYISGLISKPLGALSGYMDRAGNTGAITFTPEEENVIRTYGKYKDEVGQTIANTSKFINHVTTIASELETVASGDLTHDVKSLSNSDVMANSMRQMLTNLNDMFSNINASTQQVATGAKQVADGAQSLAQGSTEQAASIEELSASIGDIASSTKDNAEIATKTAKLSGTIRENAERGSRQMDDMITAVKDINEASLSISKIIKTIDDIAFQTNILALNAAVEAARAGQHGKGFAVVAEEVRNLASKSADAAKDTGDMIQNSMSKAELGSQIAGETAASLKEIVSGISESSELISQIAQASEAQSLAISQINTGVDQVAQVVQQNSATAEQSAAASEQMSGQSTMLEELISQFKLKDQGNFKGLPSSSGMSRPAARNDSLPNDDYGMSSHDSFGKY